MMLDKVSAETASPLGALETVPRRLPSPALGAVTVYLTSSIPAKEDWRLEDFFFSEI